MVRDGGTPDDSFARRVVATLLIFFAALTLFALVAPRLEIAAWVRRLALQWSALATTFWGHVLGTIGRSVGPVSALALTLAVILTLLAVSAHQRGRAPSQSIAVLGNRAVSVLSVLAVLIAIGLLGDFAPEFTPPPPKGRG